MIAAIVRGLLHVAARRVTVQTWDGTGWAPPRVPVEGGHPTEDMPFTIRIHKGDNPGDLGARRWIKDDSGQAPWMLVTGYGRDAPSGLDDDDMVGWSRVCGPPPR